MKQITTENNKNEERVKVEVIKDMKVKTIKESKNNKSENQIT